jgi:very-short-patch-repair endonuclease
MRGLLARDARIAALAAAQHGVVTRAQLLALGVSDSAVERRVHAGRLHRLHRGVFAVGHTALGVEGRWMAAALATGGSISHATAAAAWDLRKLGSGAIHVTVAGDAGRMRRRGLLIHRSATLSASDKTTHLGIPITTPARTIIDLSATLRGRPLEHLLDLAEQRRLVDFAELRTRPIPRSLQAVLSLYTANLAPTRSELEERFLRLCDDHGIRRPDVNTRIEGIEVDFAWTHARLIVEVDGYRYHRAPSAFETDRERDVMLALAGWQVLRFTWTQLTTRPAWVAAAVVAGLAVLARRDGSAVHDGH